LGTELYTGIQKQSPGKRSEGKEVSEEGPAVPRPTFLNVPVNPALTGQLGQASLMIVLHTFRHKEGARKGDKT